MINNPYSTAGRNQLAWVKIGLAIRFAQTLQLSQEPEEHLAFHEKEERRFTFWSVYFLDKLVSCARSHPPTILDSDCTIRLPLHDTSEWSCTSWIEMSPTLAALSNIPDLNVLDETNHFALMIFMSSVLGLIVRWAFQQHSKDINLPWDSRSEFSRIYGILLSFESYAVGTGPFETFEAVMERCFELRGNVDFQQACHYIYAHLLYHVDQCLLHHPFLLRQRLKTSNVRVPPGFISMAVERSRKHAVFLSRILNMLQQYDCEVVPSFFGYAAVIAGVVHYLHSRTSHRFPQEQSEGNFQACVLFLEREPASWDTFRRMVGISLPWHPLILANRVAERRLTKL